MKLGDKAQERPQVALAGSLLESQYRLVTDELVPADDISEAGEFPQYGDFLLCPERSPVDHSDRGETFVEIPSRLARWLVEHVEDGDWWQVVDASKDGDGQWHFDCQVVETDDDSAPDLESAAAAMDDD